MGLEWHNRPRSRDGRFARRARRLEQEAGVGIEQLHVRVAATVAADVREMALNLGMEISELVEAALVRCIDELRSMTAGDQAASSDTAADEQPQGDG